MSTHSVLDIAQFRALFAQFASETVYPDVLLNAQYSAAGNYMSQTDSIYGGLTDDGLVYALQLLTGHLIVMSEKAAGGQPSGFITSASEGDVSISITPPPLVSGWKAWLASTSYGLQLWALLSARAAGGFAIGGMPERYALRKAGGLY